MPEFQRQRKSEYRLPKPPTRYNAFVTGELRVEDLTDEEVMRGQLMAVNGSFQGRPPKSIPREFLTAIRIEQQKRFTDGMNPLVLKALETLGQVMEVDYRAQPGDAAKVKAAMYVIDRFAGKTPENVQIQAEVTSKFEDVAHDILVDVGELTVGKVGSRDTEEGEDDDLGTI